MSVDIHEVLNQFRVFEKTAEFNETIRLHLKKYRYEMNKTVFAVFELINRHAVNYGGVAWLKIETIADSLGKSKPTVRRAVSLLVRLGIFERVPYMRPSTGGNGGNIIRIVPAEPAEEENDRPEMIARPDAEKPCPASAQDVKSETESTIFKSYKKDLINNTYSDEAVEKIKTPYQVFKETAKALLGESGKQDDKMLNRMYGVYLAKLKRSAFDETKTFAVALNALKTALRASERKNIANLAGFFNNTMNNMLKRLADAETPAPQTTQYVREEYKPDWVGEEYVAPAETEEAAELRRRLEERRAKRAARKAKSE